MANQRMAIFPIATDQIECIGCPNEHGGCVYQEASFDFEDDGWIIVHNKRGEVCLTAEKEYEALTNG